MNSNLIQYFIFFYHPYRHKVLFFINGIIFVSDLEFEDVLEVLEVVEEPEVWEELEEVELVAWGVGGTKGGGVWNIHAPEFKE